MKKMHLQKQQLFVLFLTAVCGLAIVNVLGVFKVHVLSDSYNAAEFLSGFLDTFIFLTFGFCFLGYEGRGTPVNLLINGFFYLFLIAAIVSFVLFLVKAFRRQHR